MNTRLTQAAYKEGDVDRHDDGWQVLGHVTIDTAALL